MAIGQVQFRRDTEANLKAAGAVLLAAGEVGFAEDKNYFAIGDGATAFALLPVYEPSPVLYDKISGAPNLGLYLTNSQALASFDTFQTKVDAALIVQGDTEQFQVLFQNDRDNSALSVANNLALDVRLVAQEAKILFSGSYLDLINKPVLFGGAYANLTGLPVLFNGDYAALTNKPVIPAAQQSVDWNATTGNLQVLNKPVIPAAQQSVDWNATTGNLQVLNKPSIPVLPSVNNQTTFTAQATVPLVAQIAVGTAKLFKVGTAAPKWYANDAGVIRAV